MPRTSTARDRFIDTAVKLFARRGYHGTGLSELIEASGAPKGSFYHHFPGGKDELTLAAIARASKRMAAGIDMSFQQAKSFDDGAMQLCALIAANFETSGWSEGCPLTGVGLDMGPDDTVVHDALRQGLDNWMSRLADHGVRLGLTRKTAQRRAERFTIAIEGAWMLARVRRSREPFLLVTGMSAD
jgi:TetR/AcrR family transcriptional regulator, lmrAB and yxaGH operons repressor